MIESILYEDNHLLVVAKPAGITTQGSRPGERSLLAIAKEHLKQKYRKPGNVFLAAVSRLDEWVTGVVVFARTSKAAARLNEQFATRSVRKRYWGIVSGSDVPPAARLDDRLLVDDAARRVRVLSPASAAATAAHAQTGQRAVLSFRVMARRGDRALLEIDLETGRRHQIRAQLAARGWPILGDRKYDSPHPFQPQAIALHAVELRCQHPTQGTPLVFRVPPPPPWNLAAFGIDYSAWVESQGRN